MKYLLKNQT